MPATTSVTAAFWKVGNAPWTTFSVTTSLRSAHFLLWDERETPRDLAAAVLAALTPADRLAVIEGAALEIGRYVAEQAHETLQRAFEADAAREGGAE